MSDNKLAGYNISRREGRSWSNLVDVDDADQMSSLVAHIADIKEPAAPHALLDIKVPLLGVGSVPTGPVVQSEGGMVLAEAARELRLERNKPPPQLALP